MDFQTGFKFYRTLGCDILPQIDKDVRFDYDSGRNCVNLLEMGGIQVKNLLSFRKEVNY